MISEDLIFRVTSEATFSEAALSIFDYQFEHNSVYRSFCDLLYKHPSEVKTIEQIPFLPIQFFKSHKIITRNSPIQVAFSSSGTTGNKLSKHYVSDLEIYKKSFRRSFQLFYGNIKDYTILALLPSYLEREDSSLVYMANDMIKESNQAESGFFLHDLKALKDTLLKLEKERKKNLTHRSFICLIRFD